MSNDLHPHTTAQPMNEGPQAGMAVESAMRAPAADASAAAMDDATQAVSGHAAAAHEHAGAPQGHAATAQEHAESTDAATGEAAAAGGTRAFFRPKPDGAVDPAGEAGWYLERERERRGLSLQTASRATGVHPQHLRAIELGMLENLPERSEALRMIGVYARFLGFDPQPLVAHLEACLPQQKQQPGDERAFSSARIIPFPLIERLRGLGRSPGGMGASVLVLMLLFGGLSWSLWPTSSTPAGDAATTVAQAPAATGERADAASAKLADESTAVEADQEETRITSADAGETQPAADPIAALIARTVPEVAQGGQEQPAEAEPMPSRQAMQVASAEKAAGEKPVRKPTEAAASKLPPAPIAPPGMDAAAPAQAAASPTATQQADAPLDPQAVRPLQAVPEKGIALRAAEQIWLRLEDDSGLPWFVGFLKAGEVLVLPSDRPLRLSASDVHRLEWYVNGRRMGKLGKRGADFLSEPLGSLYRQSGMRVPGSKPAG